MVTNTVHLIHRLRSSSPRFGGHEVPLKKKRYPDSYRYRSRYSIKERLTYPDVIAEMEYYNIVDPYGKSNQYYNGHYVCLWQVTERKIVGHWRWDVLVTHQDWYRAIIMPAFWQHRKKVVPLAPQDELFGLSATLDQLSRRLLI